MDASDPTVKPSIAGRGLPCLRRRAERIQPGSQAQINLIGVVANFADLGRAREQNGGSARSNRNEG